MCLSGILLALVQYLRALPHFTFTKIMQQLALHQIHIRANRSIAHSDQCTLDQNHWRSNLPLLIILKVISIKLNLDKMHLFRSNAVFKSIVQKGPELQLIIVIFCDYC